MLARERIARVHEGLAGLDARTREIFLAHRLDGMSYLEIAPLHSESDLLVRALLGSVPRATGLYIPVDHFCGSFFRRLREAGKRPGRDFEAVLGNYNPVIYHNLDHSPAAIDINLPTLVRKVVDHLVWRIENRASRGRIGITVSPTLRLPQPNGHSLE